VPDEFKSGEMTNFNRRGALRFSRCVLLLASLCGCSPSFYSTTKKGRFMGKPCLEWRNQREFVFHQNLQEPFYFERANKEKIFPKSMYTDGGSIPRVLWSFSGYSPWEYGPAFLIHDWLFVAHHLHDPDYKQYDDVNKAGKIMSECMKTLMEENPPVVKKDLGRIYRMDIAVRSFFAKRLWDRGGPPAQPPDIIAEQRQQSKSELERHARASRPARFDPLPVKRKTKAAQTQR